MSVSREVACIFYEYEGGCSKGRKGTFRDACQTCKKYQPLKNGAPARKNLKRQKTERIKEQDMRRMMREY